MRPQRRVWSGVVVAKAAWIVITGPPGVGKTTLARHLSQRLRLPLLTRDDVRSGHFFTQGGWSDRVGEVLNAPASVERYLELVDAYVARGISLVSDVVVTEQFLADAVGHLQRSRPMVLALAAPEARSRYLARLASDPFMARQTTLRTLGARSIDEHIVRAATQHDEVTRVLCDGRQIGVPTLDVSTRNGYDPSLDAIVDAVTAAVGRVA